MPVARRKGRSMCVAVHAYVSMACRGEGGAALAYGTAALLTTIPRLDALLSPAAPVGSFSSVAPSRRMDSNSCSFRTSNDADHVRRAANDMYAA